MTVDECVGVWECPNCGAWISLEAVDVTLGGAAMEGAAVTAGTIPVEMVEWKKGAWCCVLCSGIRMEKVAAEFNDFLIERAEEFPRPAPSPLSEVAQRTAAKAFVEMDVSEDVN